MTQAIVIGAPSEGRSAEQRVRQAFAQVVYPITVEVENYLPRHLVLPEIHLFLGPAHEAEQRVGEATLTSADHLARLASTVEQLAVLHKAPKILTITLKPEESAAPTPDVTTIAAVEPSPVAKSDLPAPPESTSKTGKKTK